jgi:hypothetical protein
MKTGLFLSLIFASSLLFASPAPNFEEGKVAIQTCDATVTENTYNHRGDTGIYLTIHSGDYRGKYEFTTLDSREPHPKAGLKMSALVASAKAGGNWCYQIIIFKNGSGLAKTSKVFDLVTMWEDNR